MKTTTLIRATHASARKIAVAALLLAVACTDANGPTAASSSTRGPNLAASVALPSAGAAIEDALDRITPTLSDERAATSVQLALENVLGALSQPGPGSPDAAVEGAEAVLLAYARAGDYANGDAPQLDAIALALATVRGQRR